MRRRFLKLWQPLAPSFRLPAPAARLRLWKAKLRKALLQSSLSTASRKLAAGTIRRRTKRSNHSERTPARAASYSLKASLTSDALRQSRPLGSKGPRLYYPTQRPNPPLFLVILCAPGGIVFAWHAHRLCEASLTKRVAKYWPTT